VDLDSARPRGLGFGFPRSMIPSSDPSASSLCFPAVRGQRAISSVSELVPECRPLEGFLPSSKFSSRRSVVPGDSFEVLAAVEAVCWPRSRPSSPESTFEPPAVEVNATLVRGFLWEGSVGTVTLVNPRLRLVPANWPLLTGATVRWCAGARGCPAKANGLKDGYYPS